MADILSADGSVSQVQPLATPGRLRPPFAESGRLIGFALVSPGTALRLFHCEDFVKLSRPLGMASRLGKAPSLMETLLSVSGVLGAACCVGMYAAVSVGAVKAEQPHFFVVNGLGSVLILIGAAHQFDAGDAGTVGQELIWAAISFLGARRALGRREQQNLSPTTKSVLALAGLRCVFWPLDVLAQILARPPKRTPPPSILVDAALGFWAALLATALLFFNDGLSGRSFCVMLLCLGFMYLLGLGVVVRRRSRNESLNSDNQVLEPR